MYKGFLFIGDPHLSSIRPGRRLDDYAATVLDKLTQAAKIAADKQLVPVILGDLFHRNKENNLALLNRLVDVARLFPCPPLVLEGNHDKGETQLTEQDALLLLGSLGLFRVIDRKGPVDSFTFDGVDVHLWATPYGAPIDTRIDAGTGVNVMVTHHDLAFAGAYPGAALLTEIQGCNLVVNGHMHKTAPKVVKGMTTWHNPGNISRLSVDTLEHEPAVWSWMPAQGADLVKHVLEYEKHVFDMTGLQVEAATPVELKKDLPRMMRLSQFAKLLKAQDTLEADRSEDGAMLTEELKAFFDEVEAPETLRAYLGALAKEVIEERKL